MMDQKYAPGMLAIVLCSAFGADAWVSAPPGLGSRV
jgi:hypothetical protein